MTFRVFVERSKHNWKNDLDVVADEVAEVFVIPEIESSLCDLEVRACDGFGKLVEEWLLNLGKLCWIHNLKDILNFVQEHDFLCAVDFGPISEKAKDNLNNVNFAQSDAQINKPLLLMPHPFLKIELCNRPIEDGTCSNSWVYVKESNFSSRKACVPPSVGEQIR